MEYRLLGLSGCAVSALALGTLTFGNETSETDSFAQLDRFISAGGTLIDTADVYADGRSEQIIGRWLASRADARGRAVIATKGRFPTTEDPNGHGLSRRHLAAALDTSLRRLGVEAIDLYQLHGWDPLTPVEETLRFLDDAAQAGLDVTGGDRLGAGAPGGTFGNPRRPHPGSARRQPGRRRTGPQRGRDPVARRGQRPGGPGLSVRGTRPDPA